MSHLAFFPRAGWVGVFLRHMPNGRVGVVFGFFSGPGGWASSFCRQKPGEQGRAPGHARPCRWSWLKLDHGFNRDLETMSYTTAHGSPCCRRGFEVEQGFRKPYITEKLKKIRKGETQDADRGGKSFLTLYEHLETRLLLCLRLYLHFRYAGWWRAWC